MTTYQRLVRTMALGLILAVITATSGFAQTSLASLRGKVSDQQGGVLPGATVTVRQIETNATKVGVTGEVGQYYLPSLPAGTYEVTVELSGFATGKQTASSCASGRRPTSDFALKVGAVQENVTVSGQSTLVETQARGGTFIEAKSVENLPTVSRNFADLAKLAPGVTSTGGIVDGLLGRGPAPVPEPRVRRRRDQRNAVLRHAGRVVPAGLDAGIPGDDATGSRPSSARRRAAC